MATLSETAYLARKTINIGVILLVVIILGRLAILAGIALKEKYFPPPPPPATLAFGKLPNPNTQNNIATPSAITYTLETVDGSLPILPTTMKVYFMPKAGPSFGSFDKMKSQAAKMGFVSIPQKTGPTSWRFIDQNNPLRVLDIDEISENFRLTYSYLSDLSLFSQKNFTSPDDVISSAQGFFSGLGILASDLRSGIPTFALWRMDAGTLVPATAISDADAVSVTLNRADITDVLPDKTSKKYPVVSPDTRQGLVSVLFSGSGDSKKRILEARYFYSPIDQENWATYPLESAKNAFDKLKAGKAIFASLPSPLRSAITIRQVFLAYLDPYPPQSFLQPVLVFSDQKGFIAYEPIIDPAWRQ